MTKKHKNYTNILYWIAMAGLLLYFSYSKGWILADFKSITPEQAQVLLERDNNITLLDVRTPEEYKKGHIKGARLIPLGELESHLDKLRSDKNKQIIVYCHSGNRSIAASRILKKHGFTPLNVKQGIIGLSGTELEVVK